MGQQEDNRHERTIVLQLGDREAELVEKLLCVLGQNKTEVIAALQTTERHIMEAIQAFAGRVNVAFDALGTKVDGVVGDVAFLKDEIAKLQNSAGTLTPEDQATLDGVEARLGGLVTKVADLDAATEQQPTPEP